MKRITMLMYTVVLYAALVVVSIWLFPGKTALAEDIFPENETEYVEENEGGKTDILTGGYEPDEPEDLSEIETGEENAANANDTLITIDEMSFPDTNFRDHVLSLVSDAIQNGNQVPASVLAGIEELRISYKDIASIEGIKFFPNLVKLLCSNNIITTLDVSGLSKLTELECVVNPIERINISGTAMKEFVLWPQGNIEELDVSDCKHLTEIWVQDGRLKKMNASGCTTLRILYCRDNQLSDINLDNCIGLEELDCMNNKLTALDISGCYTLKDPIISGNPLVSLKADGCTSLKGNRTYANIDSVEMRNCTGLTELNVEGVRQLDVTGCTGLTFLSCGQYNGKSVLESIIISGCTNLQTLEAHGGMLENLDLKDYKKLTHLGCSSQKLKSIDISGCSNLTYLDIRDNQISELKLNGCKKLSQLFCEGNQLTSLDLRSNTELKELYAKRNPLKSVLLPSHDLYTEYDIVEELSPSPSPKPCRHLIPVLNRI